MFAKSSHSVLPFPTPFYILYFIAVLVVDVAEVNSPKSCVVALSPYLTHRRNDTVIDNESTW